jgi:hypothetical protein
MRYVIEYQSEVDDNLLTKEIEIEANDRIEAMKKFFDMNLIYRNFIDIRELC